MRGDKLKAAVRKADVSGSLLLRCLQRIWVIQTQGQFFFSGLQLNPGVHTTIQVRHTYVVNSDKSYGHIGLDMTSSSCAQFMNFVDRTHKPQCDIK
jgi:hypothetical protein